MSKILNEKQELLNHQSGMNAGLLHNLAELNVKELSLVSIATII